MPLLSPRFWVVMDLMVLCGIGYGEACRLLDELVECSGHWAENAWGPCFKCGELLEAHRA